jgi:hypothetical protein
LTILSALIALYSALAMMLGQRSISLPMVFVAAGPPLRLSVTGILPPIAADRGHEAADDSLVELANLAEIRARHSTSARQRRATLDRAAE